MNLTGLKLSDPLDLGQAQQVLYGTDGAFRRNDLTSDSETEDDASFISSFTQSFQSIQSTANDDGYSTDSTMCSTNVILTHLTKEIANLQSMTTGSFVVERTALSTLIQDTQQKSTKIKELEEQMKEYAKKKERKKRRKHKSSSSSSKRKKKSSRHSSKSKSSDKKKSSSSKRKKTSKSGSKQYWNGEETDVSMLNQGQDSREYETEAVEESSVDGGTHLYSLYKKKGPSSSKHDFMPEDSTAEESSIGSGTNLASLANGEKQHTKHKKHKRHKRHKRKKHKKSSRRNRDAPSGDETAIKRDRGMDERHKKHKKHTKKSSRRSKQASV